MKPLPILLPFSYLYGGVMALRNLFFEKKLLRSAAVGVPVISVGNLTTGGTGKTPIVELIAALLREAGKRPAIVSRGYGRRSTGFVLVSDGAAVRSGADEAGDEAYQMAKKLGGVAVIADEDRAHGAQSAIERLGCGAIVLDDGFQHRALARDCDIVLVDAEQDLFSMPMLPAGHRREPLSGLRRADAVIITKCAVQSDSAALRNAIGSFTDAPVFTSSFEPAALVDCRSGASSAVSSLTGRPAVVFCGIGQPESFRRTAASLGVRIVSFHAFADHHRYTEHDRRELASAMTNTGAELFLTTEKDARRLDGAFGLPGPVMYPAMEAAVHDAEKFAAFILARCAGTQVRPLR